MGGYAGIAVYGLNTSMDSVATKNYYLSNLYGRVRDVCADPFGNLYFIAFDRNVPLTRINVISKSLSGSVAHVSKKNNTITPNPSKGQITFNDLEIGDVVQIYDIEGRIVFLFTVKEAKEAIDLSERQKGMYFCRIINSKRTIQEKIIIQ